MGWGLGRTGPERGSECGADELAQPTLPGPGTARAYLKASSHRGMLSAFDTQSGIIFNIPILQYDSYL